MLFSPQLALVRRKASSTVTYSTEAAAFFLRITDPGTTRKNVYAALIDGLVADGVWTLIDMLHIYAADIAANALVNLKSSSFAATEVNSPSFTADQGYTGNGTTSYVSTGFAPSTGGGSFTQNSGCWGLWSRTSASSDNGSGTFSGGEATGVTLILCSATGPKALLGRCNTGGTDDVTSANVVTNGIGFRTVNRSSSSALQFYAEGSSVGTGSQTSTALCTLTLRVGGTTGALDTRQYAAAVISGSLDATKSSALYTRLATYMTAVGA